MSALETIGRWLADHPMLLVQLAIGIATVLLQPRTEEQWATLRASWPRLAGALQLAHALGISPASVAEGLRKLLRGGK